MGHGLSITTDDVHSNISCGELPSLLQIFFSEILLQSVSCCCLSHEDPVIHFHINVTQQGHM